MDQKKMFDRLVDNALDFLNKALAEIKDNPKYSLIHFHAALELFLKARLMHEHWSLVIARTQDADWTKFVSGDFVSVTMNEAAARLDKIVCSGPTQDEIKTFKSVADHRNKLVHFFHQDNTDPKVFRNQIVMVELRAWNSLHELLKTRWKDVFKDWAKNIQTMDGDLRKIQGYLDGVYENLKGRIADEIKNGSIIEKCSSCEFVAQQHDPRLELIYTARCLVCESTSHCIRFECNKCHKGIVTFNNESGVCSQCETEFDQSDLVDALADTISTYDAMNGGDYGQYQGNCACCDSHQSVFKMKRVDMWLCPNCMTQFDTMEVCQWCNELNSGDMDASYVKGCNFCEGMTGWHKDD